MNTETDMIFVIIDKFDMNLTGSFEIRVLGIFDDFDIAKQHMENLNLKNFRWVGDNRFKFSTDMAAHVGEVKNVPKNMIWIASI